MKPKHPPKVARWILEHVTTDKQKDPLSGDLLEELGSGRSRGWYWRQVAATAAVSLTRTLQSNWFTLAFSAFWVLPLPILQVHVLRETRLGRFWGYPWPYSFICAIALSVGWKFLYLWLGIASSQISFAVAVGPRSVRRLVRRDFAPVQSFTL